ncbi:MAG: zf-HC2 domain-containing protein [Myxococcota bacterium]
MSCPQEESWVSYVDGELPPPELRRVESHLVTCQSCRALVVALREESQAIADALHERKLASHAVSPAEAPAAGLAFGFPVAIAGLAAGLTLAGAVAESRLPGGLDLLNPLRLKGAYEMVFDVIFGLRDRAPGLFEFAIAVAAVLSVSTLASLGVGVLVRRVAGTTALLALCLLFAPERGSAIDLRFDQDTHIAPEEVLQETLVASGEEVRIDGVIEGDLVVWAERIRVTGRVDGNVFAFARDIELSGEVNGVLVMVAERVRTRAKIGSSVYSLAERLTLGTEGRIERDATLFGERVLLEGSVARDVVFGGERFELAGSVGRDVDVLHAHRVALLDGARVTGSLDAMIPDDTEVELVGDARVEGEVRIEPHSHAQALFAPYRQPSFYLFFALQFVASFLLGLLLYALAPTLFASAIPTTGAFFRTLGWGFAALLLTPLVLVAIAFTIVGLPIAVLGLFGYLAALYVADIAVGALIGRSLLQPGPELGSFARALLVGLAIVIVGHLIPFLGAAVGWVTLFLGLGLLVDRVRQFRPLRP